MWNDIEALEREGEQKEADKLLELYRLKFIEGKQLPSIKGKYW